MSWVPQACTLPTVEQPLRVAEFDALFATAVAPAERVGPTELRVHLPVGEETAAVARDLIARETGCCAFFAFDLRPSVEGTELRVRVPESQIAVLDGMERLAEVAREGGAPA